MTDQTPNLNPTTGFPTQGAIDKLAELGVKATEAEVVEIITADLDDDGLPAIVPVLFNRQTQAFTSARSLLEEYRSHPRFRTGRATMQTLAGFRELVMRHMDANSAIFIDMNWKAPKLLAVIDYHGLATGAGDHPPRWLKHTIEYAFPLSDQWRAWLDGNGKPMEQGAFAGFIEDHISDLSAPTTAEASEWEPLLRTKIADPAEVVTLSRGLSVSVNAEVVRAVSLQSGEGELVFKEVHRDGGDQKLTVPGLFMLSLPVFFKGENARIPVRLRYRVKDGSIAWSFSMWRPDEFVTERIEKDRDAIAVDTGLPVYEGKPEGAG